MRPSAIRRRLMRIMLLTSGLVLLLTSATFLTYDFFTFRRSALRELSTIGRIVAANSTAALAFRNPDDAREVLGALRAERHIVAAVLFDEAGSRFAAYPDTLAGAAVRSPAGDGFRFERSVLVGFEPVIQNGRRLGTLYLEADLGALYERLRLYGLVALLVIGASVTAAYLVARRLQRQISQPILALAETARAISDRGDYSVRAERLGEDELGTLTDGFNRMLDRIESQNQALTESEGRNRAIIESALDAVIAIDHAGSIVGFNPAAERMFGHRSEDVVGRRLGDVIVPAHLRERHHQGVARYLATGEARVLGRRIELPGLRADGSLIELELSITRMPGAGPAMFTGFLRDITERKHAEQRVHAQLSRLQLLNRITRSIGQRQDLSSIFRVVISTLEDSLPIDFGLVCLGNPSLESLVVAGIGLKGRALAAELGMTEESHIPIDQNGLSRCLRGELVYEPDTAALAFPFPQRLADHGLRSLVVAPLLVESQVFGVLVAARRAPLAFSSPDCEFVRQLSEHVALAAHQAQIYGALQEAYDELRQSQQTVLQHERLRALGEMASGIAHDINNAISPVALYTELLLEQETDLSPDARESLETIERASHDVAATVARLREFYRPRGTHEERAPTDLNRLVREVLHLTSARWRDMPQQRGLVIETTLALAPDLPPIMAAESEIREALTNLVFNAADAMPAGGRLTMRTLASSSEDGAERRSVHVEVSDTGVGMSEETRRRCLEPFFTTKGERGTGLGLAMVYGTAQRHSADLEIETAFGQGTTVRLSFAVPAPGARSGEPGTVHTLARSLRLLVVDDDPLLLKALQDTLRAAGHEVVTALGGQPGIETFRDALERGQVFAAVITDLGMPYVDGRQVARAVKHASPATPVIMLTGWGQRMADEGDLPEYVDRVLSKPPKLRDLNAVLVECVREAPDA